MRARVWFVGVRATLGASASLTKRAAASLQIKVSSDLDPGQAYFTRSDHYPFARQGVPAIFLIAQDDQEISERWSAQHLHQPSDDLSQRFDYEHFLRWGELFRRWTLETANAAERPLWYAGDYFGNRYAPAAKKAQRPPRE